MGSEMCIRDRWYPSGHANQTRSVTGGGYTPNYNTNIMEYVTIASTGDAKDFGDLTVARREHSSGSSSTRGIFAGGQTSPQTPGGVYNTIDYITTSSTGNAADFGDLSPVMGSSATATNSTRMLLAG